MGNVNLQSETVLEILKHERDSFMIVELNGELDLYTARLARKEFIQIINEGKHNIIVDLSNLNYLDSTGLGILILVRQMLINIGKLYLVGIKPHVFKVFKLSNLQSFFSIYDKIEDIGELKK